MMTLVINFALMMMLITWSMVKVQSAGTEESTTPMVCNANDDPQCAASNKFNQFPEFSELQQMQILEYSGNNQAFAVSRSAWKYLRAKSDQELMVKARKADRLHLLMKQWLLQGKEDLAHQLQRQYITEQSDSRFAEIVCGYADKINYLDDWAHAVTIQDNNQEQTIPDNLLQSCIKSALLQQNKPNFDWAFSMQPSSSIQASAIADSLHAGGSSAFEYAIGTWEFDVDVWHLVPGKLCAHGAIEVLQTLLDCAIFQSDNGMLPDQVVKDIWEKSFSRFDPKLWRYVMSRRDLLVLHLAFLSIKEIMLSSTYSLIQRGQNNGYLPAAFRQRMITMAIQNQYPESIAYLANCPIKWYDELMAFLQTEIKFRQQFRIKDLAERRILAGLIEIEPVQPEWEQFCQDYRPVPH
ncbi:hypothetical protein MIR68_003361 [Amoeboaphelidium protococcarum]|nr:hypothetical protein MIR68_003361 [Amoeboaphelidium protococcarum]